MIFAFYVFGGIRLRYSVEFLYQYQCTTNQILIFLQRISWIIRKQMNNILNPCTKYLLLTIFVAILNYFINVKIYAFQMFLSTLDRQERLFLPTLLEYGTRNWSKMDPSWMRVLRIAEKGSKLFNILLG